MSGRTTPDEETSPLLGHHRTESYQTLVTNETTPNAKGREAPGVNLVWVLAALWSAVFLGALDGTIVATLLSPIGAHFNRSNQSSYIGTAYLLSVCCFTPLYGRLSDILGRKGAMLLALSLFGSGTLLCGIAPSMNVLIAARAIAGMGGGGSVLEFCAFVVGLNAFVPVHRVMTVSSIAVTDLIPLKKRGLYQGLANVLFGAGAGLGGPLGGWLNDQFGWRSAFLFQASIVPILAASMILVSIKVNIPLPEEVRSLPLHTKLGRIDCFGSLTLVLTVGCLLLGLSLKSTEELPWSHPLIWGLIFASGVWGIIFVIVEIRVATYPVMPIRLIKQRTPLAASLANFFASFAAFSMLYNVPLYFSAVRLNSSTDAGLHLLPHSIALSCGSLFAGWMMRRTGKLYSLTLVSVLLGIMACISVSLWNFNTSEFHLWLDLIPQGFGISSMITSTLIAIIANVAKEDIAVATGITYLFRTTGQVLGVSLSGALLQAILTKQLRKRVTGPEAFEIIERIRHSTTIIPELPAPLRAAAVTSYADALKAVFICQVAFNVLAFLCCIPIQENPLPSIPRATMEEQERLYRDRQTGQNRNSQNESSTP
ncbi:MFS general substrate transporter [Thelephora ganbajun]|uniref:MFS general substrate transporter n=1 Tax=Thelephora ganbajun TaxID=370292 RepID=A0ACB6ZJX8_THEGA|nr:MFS general substrate transporter [Thelephora ganbajun]